MTVRINPRGAAVESRADDDDNQRSLHRGRWTSVVLSVLAVVGSFHAMVMIGIEGYRVYRTRQTVSQLELEVASLEREVASLQAILEHGDDRLYREQLARGLGYIFPDETQLVTYPSDR